jgi:membrane protein DedA with SNARE-associated domain/membrane-associated phospholipid phosphatase
MERLVTDIVAFAEAHAMLAYALAFVLAGVEAFPVFGAVVPGTAIIVGLGALVPGGVLLFWPLVAATTAGAIVGDGFSYWLGHHYKNGVASVWPLSRHPGLLLKGQEFFARHGGKAVILARFTPGVRAVVPLVAGVVGMPVASFYGVNVLSAVLWAPSHVVMGVLIGTSLTILGAIAGRLLALVMAISVLLTLVVWLTPRAIRWLNQMVMRLRGPVRHWAAAKDTWWRRRVLSLLDPARTELPGLLSLGSICIAALWLFFGILEDVISGDPLIRADKAVFELLQSLRVPAVDQVMIAITELGDSSVVLPVALVALFWLVWHRAWHAASYCIAAVGGAVLLAILLELTLQPARPVPLHSAWSAFYFPSSHSAVSTALCGFLAVLIGREVGLRFRLRTVFCVTLLALLIALSRLYLGAQWLSEVAAGFAFGLAWIALLGIAYLQHGPERIRAHGLAGAVGIALIAVGAAHIATAHAADTSRYTVEMPVQRMTLANWRTGGWAELPARRLDLFGEYEDPFTLQWVGSLDPLKKALLAHGWAAPVPWTFRSALEWLSPQPVPASLPVLPRLNSGLSEKLIMITTGDAIPANQRLVLRLWRSNVILMDGTRSLPLWIGTVTSERIAGVTSLVAPPTNAQTISPPLQSVSAAFPSARMAQRHELTMDLPWKGFVLLGGA